MANPHPQLYEIDLVVQSSARYTTTVATVLMPVIPKIGQDIYLESNEDEAAKAGNYRVTAVAYHVRAHQKTSRFKFRRTVTGLTGDLFGISLMVIPL
jgi:hypothetical protein